MGRPAVPAYLGDGFAEAPPGHRFNLYLPLWVGENWAREPDKPAGKDGAPATGKGPTLRKVVSITPQFAAMNLRLCERQAALAGPLAARGSLLAMHAVAVAPFTTGLGNEHPLENGFSFLNPYGLPYLAGSSVKGVLRAAAFELADHKWGDDLGWNDDAIDKLFGKAGENDAAADAESGVGFQRGALTFWDVIPQIEGDALHVEVMTPHQSHYYQGGASPHESGQVIPINFLTVPPRSAFAFHVQCDLPFLGSIAPELAHDGRWQQLVSAALVHAFQWLGFGAKTAVGYGAMTPDLARQAKAAEAKAAAERVAKLEAMSEGQRSISEFSQAMTTRAEQLRGGKDKANTEFHQRAQKLAKAALEGAWSDQEKAAAADAIEEWLPKVVQLPDVRDAFKKLKLRALRGLT